MSTPGIRNCLLEMAVGCDTDAGREAVARAICSISCISEGKREFARSEVCAVLLQMGARAETDNTREAVCRAVRNIAIVPEMKAEFATEEATSIFVNLALRSGRCDSHAGNHHRQPPPFALALSYMFFAAKVHGKLLLV